MKTKSTLRYEYEKQLRNHYSELVRRERHGLPSSPSADELKLFLAELRALIANQGEKPLAKAA